jgi:elongation factor G
VKGGTIPTQFPAGGGKRVREGLHAGPLAGFEMQDVRVIVYDGKHHPVDSKEVAFVSAGKKAFLDAILKARPIVPRAYRQHRNQCARNQHGRHRWRYLVQDAGKSAAPEFVRRHGEPSPGRAPLSELSNYQARSEVGHRGQGSYVIELSHYEPVPPNVQQQLASQYKRVEVEEGLGVDGRQRIIPNQLMFFVTISPCIDGMTQHWLTGGAHPPDTAICR